MSEDITNKNIKLTKKEFKNCINTVEKFKENGGEDGKGNINDKRNVYPLYPDTGIYFKYARYIEMKTRWDKFIKLNKREPSYIWVNSGNPIGEIVTSDSPSGVKFSIEEINKIAKIIQNSIKDGNGIPQTVQITALDNKKYTLKKSEFAGLFESRNVFILKNGRHPNYVTCNTTSSNPTVMDYQNNMYNCCPTSLSMSISYCYGNVNETVCASVLGTNKNGTSPNQLLTNAPKLGYKVEIIPRTYEAVKNALEKGYGVIAHIQTAGSTKASCLGFLNNYGHYIHINKASDNNFIVLDPTKGKKTCSAVSIINATNGRSINFYSVKPL